MSDKRIDYKQEYERWLVHATDDGLQSELQTMTDAEIEDAFYRDMSFGTAGLRGILGPGTNRMNVYTVRKASQGLANYVLRHFPDDPSVAISFDSRIKSDRFSLVAAGVFAANGIRVWRFPRLMPTPCLSYAVRALSCSAGVMVTASHNPCEYNGYKAYGPDGCQITSDAAEEISREIEAVGVFKGVRCMAAEEAEARGLLRDIPERVFEDFLSEVRKQSVLYGEPADRGAAIVYTPLNGTGLVPVSRILEAAGFTNVTVVEEQRLPDGTFPTCPKPNPELHEAMALGLEYCEKTGADLLLASDPDADRCGIAVRDGAKMRLMTGSEVGLLLLDYICGQRKKHGAMPARPVFVKSIVTTDLAERIASYYGLETVNVLTGFKFIGEQIGRLEAQGRADNFVFGYEESYGYLAGTYARDKDAVNASMQIAEMFAFYRAKGVSLPERLRQIYAQYGYCLDTKYEYEFPGSAGMKKMGSIMARFREGLDAAGGQKIVRTEDYLPGRNGLPPANVMKFCFGRADAAGEAGKALCGSFVVRPSGTEPKLRVYISITAEDRAAAQAVARAIASDLAARIGA